MKILYLTHQYFPRHIGGTENYLRGLAARTRAHGHEVGIITYVESPSGDPLEYGPRRIAVDGIRVVEIHYNLSVAPDPARYEYDNAFTRAAVERELDAFAPDIVHAMHTMKLSGSALAACHEKKRPVIATLCDFWCICPRHTLLKWDGSLCQGPQRDLYCAKCLEAAHGFTVERDAAAMRARNPFLRGEFLRCRRLIALSAFQRDMLIKNGYPAERLEMIPHGLDTDGLVPHVRRTAGRVRVVFIGSLVHHKGPHVLVDAVRSAPELDIECLLYGPVAETDAYTRSLRSRAADDPRIRFCGAFEPKELGNVLHEADLVAVPSLCYDNEPLVMKSALHTGLPTMASDIGSLSGMLRGYRAGCLVPPGDVDAWSRALREMVPRIRTLDPTPVHMKSMDEHSGELMEIYRKEAQRGA